MKHSRSSALVTTQPRPIELQQFAARLVDGDERDALPRRLPWLLRSPAGRSRHIGALCNVLSSVGIDPHRWRPREVIEAVDRWHETTGRRTLAEAANDPLRYFAWQLSQAIDPTAPTPTEQAQIRTAQRRAEQQERLREVEAERERMANVDHEEIARIIAQMKVDAAQAALKFERAKRRFSRLPLVPDDLSGSAQSQRDATSGSEDRRS